MYLLDTNSVSGLRKAPAGLANAGIVSWAQSIFPQFLFIRVISLLELEKGAPLKARQAAAAGDVLRRWLEARVRPSFHGRILGVDEAVVLENASYHAPNPRHWRTA